ncbi:MAG: VCBS repeat-containing protein, partial [Bacteroidota bacterium]
MQKCGVADLNNDKRKDILLFGKNTAGVETLLGQPNGTFKLGTTLFSDISVSDLCTTDINADGITDILALNWLSNQLTVFYGISRFVYTEQVAVQLPSQPAEIAITNVTNVRGFRLAVTLPEANQVQVYSGNSLGDYRLMNTIAFDRKPAGVQFAHVNGDELLDLVSSTNQGIVAVLGASPTTFTQPVVFGAAHSIASWSVADVDGDGRNDCVLADQNTKRLITLANA